MSVIIRPRSEADLDACTAALWHVHERDRYPEVWPADPAGWLSPPRFLTAVVAERDETVVGHVGLGAGGVLPEVVRRSAGTEFVVSVIRSYVPPAARSSRRGFTTTDRGRAHGRGSGAARRAHGLVRRRGGDSHVRTTRLAAGAHRARRLADRRWTGGSGPLLREPVQPTRLSFVPCCAYPRPGRSTPAGRRPPRPSRQARGWAWSCTFLSRSMETWVYS